MIDAYKNIKFFATGSDSIELLKSSEHGVGRYLIKYIGPYLIIEYNLRFKDINLDNYIDDFSFPQGKKLSLEEKYKLVVEKQAMIAFNMKKTNIESILRVIALNSGIPQSYNDISKKINLETGSRTDGKQVKNILDFLQIYLKIFINNNIVLNKYLMMQIKYTNSTFRKDVDFIMILI